MDARITRADCETCFEQTWKYDGTFLALVHSAQQHYTSDNKLKLAPVFIFRFYAITGI